MRQEGQLSGRRLLPFGGLSLPPDLRGRAEALRGGTHPRAARPHRLRAQDHLPHGLPGLFPHRPGLHRRLPRDGVDGGARARLRGGFGRRLLPVDHQLGPDPLPAPVRALPQSGPHLHAGYRRGLRGPDEGPFLRGGEVRLGPRVPRHHLRHDGGEERHQGRRPHQPRLHRRVQPPLQDGSGPFEREGGEGVRLQPEAGRAEARLQGGGEGGRGGRSRARGPEDQGQEDLPARHGGHRRQDHPQELLPPGAGVHRRAGTRVGTEQGGPQVCRGAGGQRPPGEHARLRHHHRPGRPHELPPHHPVHRQGNRREGPHLPVRRPLHRGRGHAQDGLPGSDHPVHHPQLPEPHQAAHGGGHRHRGHPHRRQAHLRTLRPRRHRERVPVRIRGACRPGSRSCAPPVSRTSSP